MRKGFYSGARAPRADEAADVPAAPPAQPVAEPRTARWRGFYKRHEKPLLLIAGAAFAVALIATQGAFSPVPQRITQEDIDQAVAHALESRPPVSPAVRAYEAVSGAVVRVRTFGGDGPELDMHAQRATGTGVVIIDKGVILTSLHVVAGAGRIQVTFQDGLQADAAVVGAQPENDLAVLQANRVPDDLRAATLRSSRKLHEGEHVVAVGFPFGIGPSVSAGVISGLKREYRSVNGERLLSNLIQFDAAANPGSSGGPLVNAAGEVVGIVTAILGTAEKSGFSGIAFAVPIESAASAAGLPPF
jgi:S1-C subfamily serine protease